MTLAQPAPSGAVELAAGLRWTGEMAAGGADATVTDARGGRFRLFTTSGTLASSAGIEGGLAVWLRPAIAVHLSLAYASSELRARIGSDVEGVPDVEVVESIDQLAIEAALMVHLRRWRPAGRATPFVSAGGGLLRHLHEGRTFVESGSVYHAGAGLDLVLTADGRGRLKATGLRADLRGVLRAGGAVFDDRVRLSPAFGMSVFARF